LVFFNIEGGHVLIQVIADDGLDTHQIGLIHGALDDSQIVHFAISIQIQIRDLPFRLVELLLKVLQVFGFSEERNDDLQIQVVTEIRDDGCFRGIALAAFPSAFAAAFAGFLLAP
jgi:hypothetical protein